jgi:hypothetical protein
LIEEGYMSKKSELDKLKDLAVWTRLAHTPYDHELEQVEHWVGSGVIEDDGNGDIQEIAFDLVVLTEGNKKICLRFTVEQARGLRLELEGV